MRHRQGYKGFDEDLKCRNKQYKVGSEYKEKEAKLCESGFHRWEVVSTPFDVKLGKLVTRYRCKRCGAVKTEAR